MNINNSVKSIQENLNINAKQPVEQKWHKQD
jgi:hypothetical protein